MFVSWENLERLDLENYYPGDMDSGGGGDLIGNCFHCIEFYDRYIPKGGAM